MCGREVEFFRWMSPTLDNGLVPFHVVKFLGAAGRAENVSMHPFDVWSHRQGTITVANPPGFGRSPGRPRLDDLVELGQAVTLKVSQGFPLEPILLSGNSLGGAVAICSAARLIQTGVRPAGLMVRDAPSLRDVIWQRYGWKLSWHPVRLVARSVPASLDVARAARDCDIPAVIVTSLRDRIVPPAAQRIWIDQYAGPIRLIELPDAGHDEPMGLAAASQYREALTWLEDQIAQVEQRCG